MMVTIYIIAGLIVSLSAGYYIAFVVSEGKDERGQAILGKSGQVAFIFIAFGFVFQSLYISVGNPSVEQIETSIFIWMAIVWASNSLSAFVLKRRA